MSAIIRVHSTRSGCFCGHFVSQLQASIVKSATLRTCVVVVAVFLSSVSLAQVQPTPGVIPIFSTLEPHEYDTINLATLGIQLNVPVRSKAGHIPFSFSLKGAAQIQYMTNINPPPNTPPHYFYGVPTFPGQENQIGVPKVQPAELFGTCGSAGVWVYYDASGTGHPTSIPPLEPPNCGTANSGGTRMIISLRSVKPP